MGIDKCRIFDIMKERNNTKEVEICQLNHLAQNIQFTKVSREN